MKRVLLVAAMFAAMACGIKLEDIPWPEPSPTPIPEIPQPGSDHSPRPPSPSPESSPSPLPEASPSPSPVAPIPGPNAPDPGTPQPKATPATCPPLARVGGGLYNCQRKGVPKDCKGELNAGDRVTLDSTHHFGRKTASACDEPWDKPCGGRMCDDIVGGTKFTVLEGGSDCRKTGTHQLTCAPLVSGRHRIQLCPNDDYRDQTGKPVDTSRAECSVVEFDVR